MRGRVGGRGVNSSGTGALGERLAARRLRRSGYRVLLRNVRLPVGELDIVCLAPDRRTIVVVEVKCRVVKGEMGMRRPEAAITAHKRRKLRSLAELLRRRRGWDDRPIRIDVVSVEIAGGASAGRGLFDRLRGRGHRAAIRHYEGAVGASDRD